jgi:HEPN domain-containing protein
MSVEKNKYEANRWLKTAKGDLEAAKILMGSGKYAHACFHSQQAGEKAVKAVWYFLDADPWGHSITKLVRDLESVDIATYKRFEQVKRCAVFLDRFYITTRYPNGLPDLTPDDSFLEEDANTCIQNAEKLIETAIILMDYL